MLGLDTKRNGAPSSSDKFVFVDTAFGVELSRWDFILLLKSLGERRRAEKAENQLNFEIRRSQEEVEKSRRRVWMDAIARSEA